MKLVSASVHALHIPFVEAFSHSAHWRNASDSVVIRVVDEDGVVGFGEGAPRTYVTGETAAGMVEHLARALWPAVEGVDLPDPVADGLAAADGVIPALTLPGVIAPNAARCALELATLDCLLRAAGASVAALLPPQRHEVVYSGVISAGPPDVVARRARQMKLIGITDIKLKVGGAGDLERVGAVRRAIGPEISLRLDANGGWDLGRALEILLALAPFEIATVEQPLPRGDWRDLKALRARSPIPLMADESLVTLDDARLLLTEEAVDAFNIRVSKCGGLSRSVEIARLAAEAGVGVQVGSQVGETAILSAAGRHLAAGLPDVTSVEGSYGTLLLTEDLSVESVRFGHGGRAPLLEGPGLGVEVVEERLRRHSKRVVALSSDGMAA